ncbi:MAG: hypothetical protein AAFQ68_07115, partial [Bacteroidota bacterium]
MKATESKSTTNQTKQNSSSPFFQKQGHDAFWGERSNDSESFFKQSGAQPKLKVGSPNDQYEKEAERTADQVVAKLNQPKSEPAPQTQNTNSNPPTIQRMSHSEGEEELQRKE